MRARRGIGHRRLARPALAAALAALVAGCASLPAPLPQDLANYDEDLDPVVAEMTASMDSPPIEPVEPRIRTRRMPSA